MLSFLRALDLPTRGPFLLGVSLGATQIIRATVEDEAQARALVLRQTDKTYSLTDAISFEVMRRAGIPHAFTFDRHFTQHGFDVLTAR